MGGEAGGEELLLVSSEELKTSAPDVCLCLLLLTPFSKAVEELVVQFMAETLLELKRYFSFCSVGPLSSHPSPQIGHLGSSSWGGWWECT